MIVIATFSVIFVLAMAGLAFAAHRPRERDQ